MGWYKVTSKEAIRYTDEKGTERRANSGSVVNIERRVEAKRLKADGAIAPLDEAGEAANVGADFTLKETFTDEPKKETPGKKKNKKGSGGKETPKGESGDQLEVGALVQFGEEIGEAVEIDGDSVLVKLSKDDSVKVKLSEVEVIG